MTEKADQLKTKLAHYWRYSKQCPLVAFEASCALGGWNDGGQADVLAVTKTRQLVETEIKVTVPDLRADRKKEKHLHFFRAFHGEDPAPEQLRGLPTWQRVLRMEQANRERNERAALLPFGQQIRFRVQVDWPTHYFYFAVPPEIIGQANEIVPSLYPWAGLLEVCEHFTTMGVEYIRVIRKAHRFNAERVTAARMARMAREMSASLCRVSAEVAGVRF